MPENGAGSAGVATSTGVSISLKMRSLAASAVWKMLNLSLMSLMGWKKPLDDPESLPEQPDEVKDVLNGMFALFEKKKSGTIAAEPVKKDAATTEKVVKAPVVPKASAAKPAAAE